MIISLETVRPGTTKIFLDDVDITNACFYAEAPDQPGVEAEGFVRMYEFTQPGKPAAVVEKTGRVRWEAIPQQRQ